MKKIILMSATALLIAGIFASCGKSTKAKMDAEWKIDSIADKTTYSSPGSTGSDEFNITGANFTSTSTSSGSSTTSNGTVQDAKFVIKKDGTWSRNLKLTRTEVNFGDTYTYVTTFASSGNWDFAAGVGEFKKNERVLFSTLSETATAVVTSSFPTQTETQTATYLDGEKVELFVITESKRKSLSMEYKDSQNESNSNGGGGTYTRTVSIKLSAK